MTHNALTTIRDLIYQARYSEAFRVSNKAPDQDLSIEYIKIHGLKSKAKCRAYPHIHSLRSFVDGNNTIVGYGDGNDHIYSRYGDGGFMAIFYSGGDSEGYYYRGSGSDLRSHGKHEYGDGWGKIYDLGSSMRHFNYRRKTL